MTGDPLEDAIDRILDDDWVYQSLGEAECGMRDGGAHEARHPIIVRWLTEIREAVTEQAKEALSDEAAMGEVADSISVYRPPPGGRTGC